LLQSSGGGDPMITGAPVPNFFILHPSFFPQTRTEVQKPATLFQFGAVFPAFLLFRGQRLGCSVQWSAWNGDLTDWAVFSLSSLLADHFDSFNDDRAASLCAVPLNYLMFSILNWARFLRELEFTRLPLLFFWRGISFPAPYSVPPPILRPL